MVGSGETIHVWDDPWLSHSEQMKPMVPAPEALQHLKVSDLIRADTYEWNIEKMELTVPFHKELRIRPSKLSVRDTLVWLKNPNGEYSTR